VDCPLVGSDDDATLGCSLYGTIALEHCPTN